MMIIHGGSMDDHGDLRQFIDRIEAQWPEPDAAREPGGEIRVIAGPAAIRVGGDEARYRKARILHQTAAEGLTGDVLAADLAPALDRDVPQDDWFPTSEVDRRNGVSPAAADWLNRNDLGLEVLLSPGPYLRRNHVSRIEGTSPSDSARAVSE
jgi:hypothetical protein